MSLYFESKMGEKENVPSFFLSDEKIKLNTDIESAISWVEQQKVNTDYCTCTFEPVYFYLSSETFPTVLVGFYLSWENFGSLCESINSVCKSHD